MTFGEVALVVVYFFGIAILAGLSYSLALAIMAETSE